MIIRKFRKEDAKKLSNMLNKVQREHLIKYYSKKVVEMFCQMNMPAKIIDKMKEREMFVAVEKGLIIGTCGLKGDEVKQVFVRLGHHGKNVGTALMKHAERIAKKRGIKELKVNASINAEGFYKKIGYKKVKKITAEREGLKFPIILMRKEI